MLKFEIDDDRNINITANGPFSTIVYDVAVLISQVANELSENELRVYTEVLRGFLDDKDLLLGLGKEKEDDNDGRE